MRCTENGDVVGEGYESAAAPLPVYIYTVVSTAVWGYRTDLHPPPEPAQYG